MALANALDIGGFITATTKTADVLQDWGKPQREIMAEAGGGATRRRCSRCQDRGNGDRDQSGPGALPLALHSTAGAAAAELARSTIIEGVPAAASRRTSLVNAGDATFRTGWAAPC